MVARCASAVLRSRRDGLGRQLDHDTASASSPPSSATASRSRWSRCWSMTRSTPCVLELAEPLRRLLDRPDDAVGPVVLDHLRRRLVRPEQLGEAGSACLQLSLIASDQRGRHDRQQHRRRVAALGAAGLIQRAAQPPACLGVALDRVVLVRPASRHRDRPRLAGAAHDQRHPRLHRLGQGGGALDPVVPSGERRLGLLPLAADDLELLGQQLHPLAQRRKREPERLVLGLVPARPQAQLDPPARDVVDGDGRARDQRRVAERDRRDHRPQPDPLGPHRDRPKGRPGVQGAAAVAAVAGEVMVGPEQRLEAARLAGIGQRRPVVPGDVLLALDHEAEPHRWRL